MSYFEPLKKENHIKDYYFSDIITLWKCIGINLIHWMFNYDGKHVWVYVHDIKATWPLFY